MYTHTQYSRVCDRKNIVAQPRGPRRALLHTAFEINQSSRQPSCLTGLKTWVQQGRWLS